MRPVTALSPIEEDDTLIARYARGDRSAFDVLFHRYRDTAYRVAYRLLGHPEDALDAVQDGFIKALAHLRGFEHRCSFKTWLLRVVSNAALDLGRQRRRRDELSAAVLASATPDTGVTPDHADPLRAAEEADLREALALALAELPAAQRRTFVLHVDGGLSYREVAEAMGVSIGTVMSRLYYARQKLKGLLAARVES